MSSTAILINLLALAGLIFALSRDRRRVRQALRMSLKTFIGILPPIITMIVAISLMMAFLRPDDISRFIGDQAGFRGTLAIAAVGSVLFMPAIIAFPFAASLLEGGASVQAVAAFITTLTMIGVVTLPLEIKEFGKRMALLRNAFSAGIALLIALIMGAVL